GRAGCVPSRAWATGISLTAMSGRPGALADDQERDDGEHGRHADRYRDELGDLVTGSLHGPRLGRFRALRPVGKGTELGRTPGGVSLVLFGHRRDSSRSCWSAAGLFEITPGAGDRPGSPAGRARSRSWCGPRTARR